MESESKPYVIISQQDGNVRLDVGTDHNSFEFALGVYMGSGDDSNLILCHYDIIQKRYDLACEARDEIHDKPLSEVSSKVKDLVRKLTGETQ